MKTFTFTVTFKINCFTKNCRSKYHEIYRGIFPLQTVYISHASSLRSCTCNTYVANWILSNYPALPNEVILIRIGILQLNKMDSDPTG